MHTPDGTAVGGTAGDPELTGGTPRTVALGDEVIERFNRRWPALLPADILRSGGHPDRLTKLIRERTGEPEEEIRAALDEILLSAARA
jgi:hypothetical protein